MEQCFFFFFKNVVEEILAQGLPKIRNQKAERREAEKKDEAGRGKKTMLKLSETQKWDLTRVEPRIRAKKCVPEGYKESRQSTWSIESG